MNKISIYLVMMLVLIIIFVSLMCISYLLPNEKIDENIAISLKQFESEGIDYSLGIIADKNDQDMGIPRDIAIIDNYTDCLILNIARNNSTEDQTILERVAKNSYYKDGDTNIIKSLRKEITNENIYNNKQYARYWFGIISIIRPLLMFFNYAQIRYIMMIFIFILLGIMATLMSKQLSKRYVIAIFIAIAMMNITVIPLSIEYTPIFCIAILSTISGLILNEKNKMELFPMVIFATGAISSFFDLLTYPIISLGFPLILIVLLENKRKKVNVINIMKLIFKCCALWIIAYGMTFLVKWIIASIVMKENIIAKAIERIFLRMNGNGMEEHVVDNRFLPIRKNFLNYFNSVAITIMAIIVIIWGLAMIFKRKNIQECKIVIALLVIAIIPYFWYFILADHSTLHAFTFRAQSVTMFALLSAMGVCVKEKNEQE